MTTDKSFHEIVRRHRLHKLAAGKAETKADVQRERLAMADEMRQIQNAARKHQARAASAERAAKWFIPVAFAVGVVVGVGVGVLVSVIA